MFIDKNLANYFVRSTERGAYGASLFKGKGDKIAADQAAVDEMRKELNKINMKGKIVIGEGDSRRLLFRIVSENGKLNFQFIHPARLNTIEPALAMTIHKAQGSEANEVILLLPKKYTKALQVNDKETKNKSYEERLLYTAITRAKNKVELIHEPIKWDLKHSKQNS